MASLFKFPLGFYSAVPDNTSVVNENTFETDYNSFVSLMGGAPQFIDAFTD